MEQSQPLSVLATKSASSTIELIQKWASRPVGTVRGQAEQSLLKSLMEKNLELSLDLEREALRIGARQERRRRTLAEAVAAATEVKCSLTSRNCYLYEVRCR